MSCTVGRKQGRRSASDAEKTKCRIMCVASQLFFKLGYDRVSLRNISEQAGVSHSLIRHHFGSKEKIWHAISDGLHEFMTGYRNELMKALPDNLQANEYLYQFTLRMMALLLVQPAPMQLVADAVRQQTSELVDYFINSTDDMLTFFLDLADKHNEQFPENPIDIYEFKWNMMMYCHGAASLKPFMKQIWMDDQLTHDDRLLAHWKMFESQIAKSLAIAEPQRVVPEKLTDLVIMELLEDWNEFDPEKEEKA